MALTRLNRTHSRFKNAGREDVALSNIPKFDLQRALWSEYNTTKSPDSYEQLMDSLKPLVMKNVLKYKNAPLPLTTIEAEAYRLVDQALNTYDPNKASIGTHVTNYLKKLYRYVGKYQNVGRIPEEKIQKIHSFLDAKHKLDDKLQREPTLQEIAEELGEDVKQTTMLDKMIREDYMHRPDIALGNTKSPLVKHYSGNDILMMVRQDLNPEETRVVDALLQGKDTKEIAKMFNTSVKTINKKRVAIGKKIKERISQL